MGCQKQVPGRQEGPAMVRGRRRGSHLPGTTADIAEASSQERDVAWHLPSMTLGLSPPGVAPGGPASLGQVEIK